MHRDHKLALSLGLLLIGVAAALCFPREQQTDLANLQLEGAAELDAAIDLLPVRVYTESHADSVAVDTQSSEILNPELADPFSELALLPGAPDPIPTVEIRSTTNNRPTALATTPPPPSESTPVVAPPTRVATETATPDVVDTAPPRAELNEPLVYQVRPGDTLSDLSGRFLGSTRRFLELYEANRDVLASPDDLKVGMLLTIPRQNREGGNRGTGGGTPRATEGDAPAPDAVVSDGRRDGSSPLFRPAARSPFAPRFDEDGRPIQ